MCTLRFFAAVIPDEKVEVSRIQMSIQHLANMTKIFSDALTAHKATLQQNKSA